MFLKALTLSLRGCKLLKENTALPVYEMAVVLDERKPLRESILWQLQVRHCSAD